jgi:hypothetical protein
MLAGDPEHHAVDAPRLVGHQRNRPGVVVHLDAESVGTLRQGIDQVAAAHLPHDLGEMPARTRLGGLVEGPGDLVARPDQAVAGTGRLHLARQVAQAVADPLGLEPVEVREGVVGVEPGALLVRIRTARHHHVAVEVLSVVLVAGGALHLGAAAAP